MAQYLLGELSEREKTRMEERCFSDDDCYEQLLSAEDELIDQYVRGELSPSYREKFERLFLIPPRRRRRVEFARALLGAASSEVESPPPHSTLVQPDRVAPPEAPSRRPFPARTFSWVAVLLILGAVCLWLMVTNLRLRQNLQRIQVEDQTLRREEQNQRARGEELAVQVKRDQEARTRLEGELAKVQTRVAESGSPPPLVFMVLSPGRVREPGQQKRLPFHSDEYTIRAQVDLAVKGPYLSYRATLRAATGEEIWSRDGLKPRPTRSGHAVFLRWSSSLINSGSYILRLQGNKGVSDLEDAGEYKFSVSR